MQPLPAMSGARHAPRNMAGKGLGRDWGTGHGEGSGPLSTANQALAAHAGAVQTLLGHPWATMGTRATAEVSATP